MAYLSTLSDLDPLLANVGVGSDGIRMNFSHVKYVPIDFR